MISFLIRRYLQAHSNLLSCYWREGGAFYPLIVPILIIFSYMWQVMFYTLAVVTFGTAVPAGQFVPGIMIGSTYGRLVGMLVVNNYGKLNIEEGTWVLTNFFSFSFWIHEENGVDTWLHLYIILYNPFPSIKESCILVQAKSKGGREFRIGMHKYSSI